MGQKTKIEWAEVTWNPTTGCDKISPGCDNCYAMAMAARLQAMGVKKYSTDGQPPSSGPGFGVKEHPQTLDAPRRWRNPRLVFVDSMSDLFHPTVSDSFIASVFEVMVDTPRHTYQVLTKRSKRLLAMSADLPWPANVWMGVSVETAAYNFRVRHLCEVPAAVRFVSAEPLLGPLDGLPLERVHWLIAGGESGPGHRAMRPEWVASLRDACDAAGVAFFFKQWGGTRPKSGGRLLDGRLHDAMPAKVAA